MPRDLPTTNGTLPGRLDFKDMFSVFRRHRCVWEKFDETLERLEAVLKRLGKFELKLKPSK